MKKEFDIDKYLANQIVKYSNVPDEEITNFSKNFKIPVNLLSIPGVLQDGVDFYNATARRAQPQFAVTTMLAVGATCMGRRFVTDLNNYPSIFEIMVGETGCGKERGFDVIHHLLEKAGLSRLVACDGYTSGSGVISALTTKPSHITMIDEMGEYLKFAIKGTDDNKKQALTQLMQVFGRLGGTVLPPARSTLGLTEDKRKILESRECRHPAITLLALSTPSTLYEALSSREVSNGFLNRFIIVETPNNNPVSISRHELTGGIEPSDDLINWMKKCSETFTNDGDFAGCDTNLNPPSPKVVPFSEKSIDLLDEWDMAINDANKDRNCQELNSMFVRTVEIAQRIALIVAVSCGSETIEEDHTAWALNYADYYAEQTVGKLCGRMSNSPFEAACKEISGKIIEAGSNGLTEYELQRKSAKFAAMNSRERTGLCSVLEKSYHVVRYKFLQTGAGKPRIAFVYFDDNIYDKYETQRLSKK